MCCMTTTGPGAGAGAELALALALAEAETMTGPGGGGGGGGDDGADASGRPELAADVAALLLSHLQRKKHRMGSRTHPTINRITPTQLFGSLTPSWMRMQMVAQVAFFVR